MQVASGAFLAADVGPTRIAEECDAHIKMEFGIMLDDLLKAWKVPVYLVPSYKLGNVRYDFAVLRWDAKLVALIECEAVVLIDREAENELKAALAERFELKIISLRPARKHLWLDTSRCFDHIAALTGWS